MAHESWSEPERRRSRGVDVFGNPDALELIRRQEFEEAAERAVRKVMAEREGLMLYVNQKPKVFAMPDRSGNGVIRVQFADVTLAMSLNDASWLAANLGLVARSIEMSEVDRKRLKPGDRVLVTDDNGIDAEYVVKASPWQLGHGDWLIGLAGISGGYSLDRVIHLVQAGD